MQRNNGAGVGSGSGRERQRGLPRAPIALPRQKLLWGYGCRRRRMQQLRRVGEAGRDVNSGRLVRRERLRG